MTENNGSAGILYKRYLEEQKKQSDEFKKSFAKILLKLPVPMSYEVWCYLHSIVGDVYLGSEELRRQYEEIINGGNDDL